MAENKTQKETPRESVKPEAPERRTPWGALVSLWLAFAVLAWLWSLAKRH